MEIYTCPMHPEVRQDHPGNCPKCGMKLVKEDKLSSAVHNQVPTQESYRPLFVIVGLIALVTAVLAFRDALSIGFKIQIIMANFMAGFFLVFSGFKLVDLKGFAQGYSTYDILAKKFFNYGYIYPFLELTLGLLFVMHIFSPFINIFTFILMGFSGLGVAIKIAKHEKFQCACLGTFLKVPLTKVTLIEDFGMAAMALSMLFF